MSTIYERLQSLCEANQISGSKMCIDLGMSKSFMTELRKGRAKSIKVETADKIAKYFGVSVDYLLTGEESEQKEKLLVNGDEELTEYLEMLKNRSECRMLFKLAQGATKEDVEKAVKIIEALRK